MHIFTDLRATANGGPSVDHRPVIDARADVDEAWHQNDVFADKAAVTCHSTGHDAEA